MAVTIDSRTGLPSWTSDSDQVARTQFQNGFQQLIAAVALAAQGVSSAKPAAGKWGRFWLSTDTGIVEVDDGVQWRVVGARVVNSVTQPADTGSVAATVKALSGQSGDLQQWVMPNGTVLAAVSSAGVFRTVRAVLAGVAGQTTLEVNSGDPGQVPVIVRGAPGQTVDLQQWRNQANQQVTRLTPTGDLIASGDVYSANAPRLTLTGKAGFTLAANQAASTGIQTFTRAFTDEPTVTFGVRGQAAAIVASIDTLDETHLRFFLRNITGGTITGAVHWHASGSPA